MPVYNGERYLRLALDSVLGQTLGDFELIVVDDGSSDSTPQLLASYRDARLQIVPTPHGGLIAALNAGLAHCTGTYIARMDADDVSYPDRLARQADFLDAHTDVDLVTCWSDLLDEQGGTVGRMTGGLADDMILELAGGNDIVHGSIMVRRASLPPPPVFTHPPEDYRLWLALARAGKRFACVPESLYGFREHRQRHSLVQAQSQSRGIVDVQWPLLEECTASRNLDDPAVRSRLILGWGRVGGAAYRSGQPERGRTAYRRFRELAGGTHDELTLAATVTGAESLVWGGCPFRQRLALRLLELRLRPARLDSYRKLLLALPFAESLRAWRNQRR
jgi:hypothetical protein